MWGIYEIYIFRILKNAIRNGQKVKTDSIFKNIALTSPSISPAGYLQWDTNHSVRRNINYFYGSWLTVLQSGDYYVYSRVTFSKGDAVNPLTSRIMLRKSKTEKEKIVMQAYCSLGSHPGKSSGLCTATQGEVIRLEKGNQLGVWTENLSLVSYTEGATTFGMYQL